MQRAELPPSILAWAKTGRYLAAYPAISNPPANQKGTAYLGGKYAQKRIEVAPEQCEALIKVLPVQTPRAKHPARARIIVAWETGLRRATLDQIEAPGDYYPGRQTLRIRDEIDKARFGRELPITDAARAALDEVCPTKGLLFGPMNLHCALKKAALAIGMDPDAAHHLSNHDFRHGRLTDMGEHTTELAGMAFLAGHKHVTTTAKYVHSSRRAGERVLRSLNSGHQLATAVKVGGDTGHQVRSGSARHHCGSRDRGRTDTPLREPDFESRVCLFRHWPSARPL